jgi:hypothetical protein
MDTEHERYERMVEKAVAEALADPVFHIQLAGLRGQEREDRAAAIIRARLKADPKVRPLLDALRKQMVEAEIDRGFEAAVEELVAAGKVRRELDPETGEVVHEGWGGHAMTTGDGPVSARHNRLATLAVEIAEHHGAAGAATREAIRHAIEAGRRLAEAKKLVGHGGWLAWLAANVPGISARTAQRYLAAAHHAAENDTVSLFRLRDLARRPRPTLVDRAQAAIQRYQAMLEAVLADMEAPGADEAFRKAQEVGLHAGDLVAELVAKSRKELGKLTAAFGAELAQAKAAMPAGKWGVWLQAQYCLTPEVAALVIDAAPAARAGRPFDVKAISDALAALDRAAA